MSGLSAFKKLLSRFIGGERGIALGSGGAIVLLVVGMAGAEERRIPVAPADYLKMENPFDVDRADEGFLKKAGKLYKRKCKNCHGKDGDGKGSKAEFFEIKPAAFSDPGYLKGRKDGQLFWILMNGSEGTEMEPKGPGSRENFSKEELWSLIVYMRKKFTRPAGK
jgi:mono/diheme cytochrome c family protein|tara:strand:+ start:158 stop:652 length:495 start_codon:yes stop_codon:yes gene_type:complete